LENVVKEVEIKVVSIQNAVNITIETMQERMKVLEEQVEEHLKSMDEQMTQVKTNFKVTYQYYITKIQAHCQQQEAQLQQELHETLPNTIAQITQKVIESDINPQLDQHIKLLQEKTQEAIATIQYQQNPPNPIPPCTVPPTTCSQRTNYATTAATSPSQRGTHTLHTSNNPTNHT